jgi:UPF0716 family protein affecting phage T7 exclusion
MFFIFSSVIGVPIVDDVGFNNLLKILEQLDEQ